MTTNRLAERLEVAAELESRRGDVARLAERVGAVRHWLPARPLAAQCREATALLDDLRERLERKLVVALVGPTGSGKSTLLNALAGNDSLSRVGHDRPTTRGVVVFCREATDSEPLRSAIGDERVDTVCDPRAAGLENVILVDTPDTDSDQCLAHRPVVEELMRHTDVVLCVFNSQNPKRRDHIDFLGPLVNAFPHDALVAILSHCDRVPREELTDVVLPDFRAHLGSAWGREPVAFFCVSGRRHLRDPAWPADAPPLHETDDYDSLREFIFGALNRGGVVVDTRLRQARWIVTHLRDATSAAVEPQLAELRDIANRLKGLERAAATAALESLPAAGSSAAAGADLALYQRLAQTWWGPMGWTLALWSRLLAVGAGALNILRIGRPLRQVAGAISAGVRLDKAGKAVAEAHDGVWVDRALGAYRAAVDREWTDLGVRLTELGFDDPVLDPENAMSGDDEFRDRLIGLWEASLGRALDTVVRRLGAWWLQFALNGGVLVILGMIAYETVLGFWRGEYLSADYFRHASITVGVVWLLSFVLLQWLIGLGRGHRLLRMALRLVQADAAAASGGRSAVAAEIDKVTALGGVASI